MKLIFFYLRSDVDGFIHTKQLLNLLCIVYTQWDYVCKLQLQPYERNIFFILMKFETLDLRRDIRFPTMWYTTLLEI